jgi:hypothetical protein
MEIPVEQQKWSDQIPRNCSACTFALNPGCNICPMCDTVNSDSWNYVQDQEGDTTYQNPYTKVIVDRAAKMVNDETLRICK